MSVKVLCHRGHFLNINSRCLTVFCFNVVKNVVERVEKHLQLILAALLEISEFICTNTKQGFTLNITRSYWPEMIRVELQPASLKSSS